MTGNVPPSRAEVAARARTPVYRAFMVGLADARRKKRPDPTVFPTPQQRFAYARGFMQAAKTAR